MVQGAGGREGGQPFWCPAASAHPTLCCCMPWRLLTARLPPSASLQLRRRVGQAKKWVRCCHCCNCLGSIGAASSYRRCCDPSAPVPHLPLTRALCLPPLPRSHCSAGRCTQRTTRRRWATGWRQTTWTLVSSEQQVLHLQCSTVLKSGGECWAGGGRRRRHRREEWRVQWLVSRAGPAAWSAPEARPSTLHPGPLAAGAARARSPRCSASSSSRRRRWRRRRARPSCS